MYFDIDMCVCATIYNAYMCGYSYSILSNARVICMHDGLWYGIIVLVYYCISISAHNIL
jgi:hypothetical protein